jgi:outer membrane protein assembly factor BamB
MAPLPESSPFGGLAAFDANRVTNCSGVPKTCVPLWTGAMPFVVNSTPAVANGVVYIANNGIGLTPTSLYAFDAVAGTARCSGTGPTKTCTPLWTALLPTDTNSSPAVAGGTVWIGASDNRLYAFDAAGNTKCSGTPKTCTPLRIAAPPIRPGSIGFSSPTIASGVIYIRLGKRQLRGLARGNRRVRIRRDRQHRLLGDAEDVFTDLECAEPTGVELPRSLRRPRLLQRRPSRGL